MNLSAQEEYMIHDRIHITELDTAPNKEKKYDRLTLNTLFKIAVKKTFLLEGM